MEQDKLVKDIVCGMVKPVSHMPYATEFAGKKFYFCSKQDKDIFAAYPERWAKEEK